MADNATISSVGRQLTDVLTATYTTDDASTSLVYLPGGVSVPGEIIQQGAVNPVALQAFLSLNFDAPFLMSMQEGTVHGRDETHGAASEIYIMAATAAQPAAPVGSDAWKRGNALIARAAGALGLAASNPDVHLGLTCEPGDWMDPARAEYWVHFDSGAQASAPPSQPPAAPGQGEPRPSPPHISPRLWSIRPDVLVQPPPKPDPVERPSWFIRDRVDGISPAVRMAPNPRANVIAAATAPVASAPVASAHIAPIFSSDRLRRVRLQPLNGEVSAATAASAHGAIDWHKLVLDLPPLPPPEQSPAPSTSTEISIRLEHQCVTFSRVQDGTAWWNDVFLSDSSWYVPGMRRGGLLPSLSDDPAAALHYGLPIALVVVRNLEIRGRWSGTDAALLESQAALLGPFSLAGSGGLRSADGSITYSRPGAQIVALICRPLPVLPPQDAPADAAATASSPTPASS